MLVFANHTGQRPPIHFTSGGAARLEVNELLGVLVLLGHLCCDHLLHAVHLEAGVGLELGGEDALLCGLLDAHFLEVRELAPELGCCRLIAQVCEDDVMAVVHKDRGSLDVWPSLRASTQVLLIGSPLEDATESLLNDWAVCHTK